MVDQDKGRVVALNDGRAGMIYRMPPPPVGYHDDAIIADWISAGFVRSGLRLDGDRLEVAYANPDKDAGIPEVWSWYMRCIRTTLPD